jgi:hypothetical protein
MRKILYVLLAALVIIQFIRPSKNSGNASGPNDIQHTIKVPEQVMGILRESCYDCHSNHTDYPWYTNIQPLGWWIQHHVDEGKEELNFSEFKTYPLKKQLHKLHESEEMVEENEMPLGSYTMLHGDAELNKEEVRLLLDWVGASMQELGGKNR